MRLDVTTLHALLLELGERVPVEELDAPTPGAPTLEVLTRLRQRLGALDAGQPDEATLAALQQEAERCRCTDGAGMVEGCIRQADGRPAPGARVRLVHHGLRDRLVIGQTRSGRDGRYQLHYRRKPGLAIRIHASDLERGQTVESGAFYNPPASLIVDLAFGIGAHEGRSELEQLEEAVAPFLDGVAPSVLTREDVREIARRGCLDAKQVQLWAWAHKRGAAYELPPALLYGFGRAGLPTAIPALVATPPERLLGALDEMLVGNIVPFWLRREREQIVERFAALAARLFSEDDEARAASEILLPLATAVGLPRSAQARLVERLTAGAGSEEERWAALAADAEVGPFVDRLQLGIRVAAIARNHQPIVNRLVSVLETGDRFVTLAGWTRDQWQALLTETGVPEGVPGATREEQVAAFSWDMVRTFEVLMPMETFRARLQDPGPFRDTELQAFLDAHPSLDLGADHVGHYLDRQEIEVGADLRARLMRLQRLFRLTPRAAEVAHLWAAGFDSAATVVETGRAAFLDGHGAALGGAEQAADVFDRAQQIAAAAALLYGQLAPATHALPTRVLPPLDTGA